jgi:hypothetical protein
MRFLLALAGMLTSCAMGCGGNERRSVVPASGIVRIDGRPQRKLSVLFFPAGGRPAGGVTDAEGRFRLTTFEPGDGALIGEHAVTISPIEDPPIYMPQDKSKVTPAVKVTFPTIPAKYFERATTDLKQTVTAAGPNEFMFDISSK